MRLRFPMVKFFAMLLFMAPIACDPGDMVRYRSMHPMQPMQQTPVIQPTLPMALIPPMPAIHRWAAIPATPPSQWMVGFL